MIIITTLKQKDLSAISAEQLLLNRSIQTPLPDNIERFTLYNIQSDDTKEALLTAINDSLLFANPNKHHLITESNPETLPKQCLYFHITRKTPCPLHHKIKNLNRLLNTTSNNTNVFASDLWGFKYSNNIDIATLNTNTIIENIILSSPTNLGLFAHPLIHNVTPLTYEQLTNTLTSHTACYSSTP
jgi:hypothetical protein